MQSPCPNEVQTIGKILWLISTGSERIGYITNFCSMIELLHERKNSSCWKKAFRHLIMSQQPKRNT